MSARSPLHRRRRAGRSLSCLAAVLVAGAATWAGPSFTAVAAVSTPAIVAVDVAAGVVGPFDRVRVDLGFRLPATAQPGDRFSLTLPTQLVPIGPGFDVLDGAGATIAVASTAGNTVSFTLTSYVATHSGVAGLAYLDAGWDRRDVDPGQTVTLSFDADGVRFDDVVTVGTSLPNRSLLDVWQGWADERAEDTTGTTGALRWLVASPRIGPNGASTVTITATPSSGSVLWCSRLGIGEATKLDEFNEFVAPTPVPSARRTVTCTDQRIDVTVTGVAAGSWVVVNGRSTVVDAARDGFAFAGSVTVDGATSAAQGLAVRARAGGNGEGVTRGSGGSSTTGSATVSGTSVTSGAASAGGAGHDGAVAGSVDEVVDAAGTGAVPADASDAAVADAATEGWDRALAESGSPGVTSAAPVDPSVVEQLAAAGAEPASRSGGFQLRALAFLVAVGAAVAGFVTLRRRAA